MPLQLCIDAGVDIVLLDNFTLPEIQKAVRINDHRLILEVSGGVHLDNIVAIAATGVQRISVGALTKNCQAIDLSLLVDE